MRRSMGNRSTTPVRSSRHLGHGVPSPQRRWQRSPARSAFEFYRHRRSASSEYLGCTESRFAYWSSTTNAKGAIFAWSVKFASGFVDDGLFGVNKSGGRFVRGVRGGS